MNNTVNTMSKPITRADVDEARAQIKKYVGVPFAIGAILCILLIAALIFTLIFDPLSFAIEDIGGLLIIVAVCLCVIKMWRVIANFGKNANVSENDSNPGQYSELRLLTENFVEYARPARKAATIVFFVTCVLFLIPAYLFLKYGLVKEIGIWGYLLFVLATLVGGAFSGFLTGISWGLGSPKAWGTIRKLFATSEIIIISWIVIVFVILLWGLLVVPFSYYIIIKASIDIVKMDKICKRGY